jgi:hypothetical protein
VTAIFPPNRIVCLTEETVETLYFLGERDRIVGISGYVVRPLQARREKPRVSAFTSALKSRGSASGHLRSSLPLRALPSPLFAKGLPTSAMSRDGTLSSSREGRRHGRTARGSGF